MMNNQYEEYKGMRALLMTRVSTPRQEEGYGHPAQEQACREKLIEPLNLQVVDVIRDTYSGLEFMERKVLDEILRRARHKEFDLLITDVLDRLGRKGLERELWRMQLRATGVRMLTTDPSDHADDDSLVGEMVRILKGYQAEDELNNIRRRTMNGRRAKAEGRQKDGTIGPRRVIGWGEAPYAYGFVLDDKGKKVGLSLKYDVVHIDQYGEEWTQVKVVTIIFKLADDGMSTVNIARYLNERGIPSPRANKPRKRHEGNPIWQPSELNRMMHFSDYWGEHREFKTKLLPKVPGRKSRPRQRTSEEEQVVIPVPAIVSKEHAEKVHRRLDQNRKRASRNNPNPEDTLFRAGLVKCAYCGSTMTVGRSYTRRTTSKLGYYLYYHCSGITKLGKCQGCHVKASLIEEAAWAKVVEIANDPSELEKTILARRPEDPTEETRKNINKKLADIKRRKAPFQQQLAELMMEGKLDADTKEFLMGQLQQLATDERGWITQLSKVGEIHDNWKRVYEKLEELRNECARMRENIHDPNYTLSYNVKRDFIEYLGITVTVWRAGYVNPETGKPQRFTIVPNPPDIMTLIASIPS